MGKTFKFWWLCARMAFWGNAASANDWQWVFANPFWQSVGSTIGAGLGAFASHYWRGAPMMSPETPVGVFLGGLFGFAFTWLIFFIMRFLRTPATLYHEQKDRADTLEGLSRLQPRRISFIELRAIAVEYGWDFANYSDQLLTLTHGVRQAAIDDKVMVEGRKGCQRMPESMSGLYPLQPIPKEHLLDWWIDLPRDKNWNVRTYQPGNWSGSDENCYVDLHLNDETRARAWLATDAAALKQPQPDIEAEKALVHIAWYSAVGGQRASILAFETAARDGRLQVWGCSCTQEPNVSMVYKKIDRDYWSMANLDVESFILGDGPRSSPSEYEHGTQTKQRTLVSPDLRESSYWHLRVNRDHVLKLWPTIRSGSPIAA